MSWLATAHRNWRPNCPAILGLISPDMVFYGTNSCMPAIRNTLVGLSEFLWWLPWAIGIPSCWHPLLECTVWFATLRWLYFRPLISQVLSSLLWSIQSVVTDHQSRVADLQQRQIFTMIRLTLEGGSISCSLMLIVCMISRFGWLPLMLLFGFWGKSFSVSFFIILDWFYTLLLTAKMQTACFCSIIY